VLEGGLSTLGAPGLVARLVEPDGTIWRHGDLPPIVAHGTAITFSAINKFSRQRKCVIFYCSLDSTRSFFRSDTNCRSLMILRSLTMAKALTPVIDGFFRFARIRNKMIVVAQKRWEPSTRHSVS
jgi:hypothetical protein